MPWGDRTGPNGEGSMTGRGAGDCAPGQAPLDPGVVPDRGFFGRLLRGPFGLGRRRLLRSRRGTRGGRGRGGR